MFAILNYSIIVQYLKKKKKKDPRWSLWNHSGKRTDVVVVKSDKYEMF